MIGAGAALHAALDPGREAEQVLQDDHRAVRHVPGRQVARGHPSVQGHHPLITGTAKLYLSIHRLEGEM